MGKQLTGDDGDPLNEYEVTVKVKVRDYSTSDATIGMFDVFNDPELSHWIVGDPDVSAIYVGPAMTNKG